MCGRVGDNPIVGRATDYLDGFGTSHVVAGDSRECSEAFQYADTRRSGTFAFKSIGR